MYTNKLIFFMQIKLAQRKTNGIKTMTLENIILMQLSIHVY